MEYLTITLWFSLVWAILQVVIYARFTSKLPPGPISVPVIGSLFKVGSKTHESLAELAKTYGPLMTLQLGSVTTIVVSSANMAKEVLQKHDQPFSARTIPDAVRILNHHKLSMAWLPSTDRQWRNLRKFFTSQMFTTQRLNDNETVRLQKVKDLIDYLRERSRSRRVINIGQIVYSTILNMISNTMFSMDVAQLDSDFAHEFKALVRGIMEEVGSSNLSDYFPLLRPFDPQGIRRRMTINLGRMDKLFDTIIDKRLQSRQQNATYDLLDVLLQHTQENAFKLSHLDIKALLEDIFLAGTDTSSVTIEWAMAELLRNPEIMRKARLELKENINNDKLIEESDIARLPYLQAVVKETLRLHPSGPLSVPRRAETDVQICGFTVPKNAQVLINAWAISRDPEVWSKPTSFEPERFLGSSVDFKGRDFEFIPFGAGRRICPGLPLAYRMLHLILASLLHSFNWELEVGMEPEDINMEEKFGFTLQKSQPLYAIPVET